MFYTYLQVLFPSQPHVSCLSIVDLHSKVGSVVCYDGLNVRLVMHVLHEFITGFVSHTSCPGLKFLLASEEILHIDAMYPVIIPRMSNECDVLSNVVRGRLTHSSAVTCAALLLNTLPSRSGKSGKAT
jgi:hypothetical protein